MPRRTGKRELHGLYKTVEFTIWTGMKMRCENKNHMHFHNYGGRGIIICERWQFFENFYADMGARPSRQHQLERIDNNKGYEPENCKWATVSDQANNRRNNVIVTVFGKKMTLAQAITKYAVVADSTVRVRIDKGWTIKDALTTPRQGRGGPLRK